jgi:hypothetical protein
MTPAPIHPGTQILLTLCQRRLQEVRTNDEPLLTMLVSSGETLPMDMAADIEAVANVYFRAAGEIRRRHYLAARPAERSPSARTTSRAMAQA